MVRRTRPGISMLSTQRSRVRVFNAPRNDASTNKREPDFTILCGAILPFASFLLKPAARHGTNARLKSKKEGPDIRVHPVVMSRAIANVSGLAGRNATGADEE